MVKFWQRVPSDQMLAKGPKWLNAGPMLTKNTNWSRVGKEILVVQCWQGDPSGQILAKGS